MSTKLYKKDFEDLAARLRAVQDAGVDTGTYMRMVKTTAQWCAQYNDNFLFQRFMRACGVSEDG